MSKFRAYGVVGIGVKNGNWNADFDGFPKMVGDMIIGSDKALKYAYRYVEEKRNANSVMYYKFFTIDVLSLTCFKSSTSKVTSYFSFNVLGAKVLPLPFSFISFNVL